VTELCVGCGQPFEAEVPGFVCTRCGHVVEAGPERCPMCNLELPPDPRIAAAGPGRGLPPPFVPPPRPPSEPLKDTVLGKFLEFREQSRSEGAKLEHHMSAMPEESEAKLLAELESLWKLSEPFEQVVTSRRKRLEQMDRLIAGARRRIRELEMSELPEEVKEREELKKQLAEVLQERDEILKIEFGITEMERIYRNIITLQQKELKTKEESLKARLEGFRKEIQVRDEERRDIADRERELVDRERALADRERSHSEKEQGLAQKEKTFSTKSAEFPENPEPLDRGESDGVTRSEWLKAQKEIQESLVKMRRWGGGSALVPAASTVRDLQIRISELEELFERTVDEKARMEGALRDVQEGEEVAKQVLKVIDELLGELPDKTISEFAKSKEFERYEALLKRLGL
jgi:DNA repair exonuclease SbcCD ATPase subunit